MQRATSYFSQRYHPFLGNVNCEVRIYNQPFDFPFLNGALVTDVIQLRESSNRLIEVRPINYGKFPELAHCSGRLFASISASEHVFRRPIERKERRAINHASTPELEALADAAYANLVDAVQMQRLAEEAEPKIVQMHGLSTHPALGYLDLGD